ncbi:hypothetical protein SG18_21160 [Pandoraea apista]|nr:hypothetical protein SG18_21160 [Pandoraea apista]AKH75471.1 hypothetical protein XM39_21345 [Pandoraea apista]AKI64826.1 hypothetical protein AA956_14660 [Pandoraea apista]
MRVLITLAIAILCSAFGSWNLTRNHYLAEISDMKRDEADARATAEKKARNILEAEQERGNGLSDKLAKTESALTKQSQELSNALSRLTTGRKCLDDRVVSVLNGTSSGAAADDLRTGTRTSDATDGPAASDTDVAGWISQAKGQYEICRARLGALIDFEEGRIQ